MRFMMLTKRLLTHRSIPSGELMQVTPKDFSHVKVSGWRAIVRMQSGEPEDSI
jgi:hypothetical protein